MSGVLKNLARSVVEPAAEKVLQLLRSGRASEVTDDMLDMGDPVLNARLNMYLYDNYDLPMDEASRAARAGELGFGGDWYHGTSNDFQAFDVSPLYRRVSADEGVFLASKPNAAEGYGNALVPAVHRPSDPLREVDLGNPREVFNMIPEDRRPWSGSFADYRATPGYGPGEIMPRDDFADVFADYVNSGWDVQYNRVNDVAGDGRRGRHTILQVADPANIRSRFARFDPRLAHLRNLSAGVGGAAVGLGAAATGGDMDEIERFLAEGGT